MDFPKLGHCKVASTSLAEVGLHRKQGKAEGNNCVYISLKNKHLVSFHPWVEGENVWEKSLIC